MRSNSTLVVGSLNKPTRLLDFWATKPTPIQNEINIFLQYRPIQELEISTYENEAGEVVKNSATYYIDTEAKWSDGVPITSKDFKLWFDIKKDDSVPLYIKDPWVNAELEIISDFIFEITFDPAYQFIEENAPFAAPYHLLHDQWIQWKNESAKKSSHDLKDYWDSWLENFTSIKLPPNCVNGPYKLSEWLDNTITLTRNPMFNFEKKGSKKGKEVSKVIYKFYNTFSELLLAVRQNEIDVFTSPFFIEDIDNFDLTIYETYEWEHLDFNLFKENANTIKNELDDKLIRKALLFAINREQIVKELYGEYGEVANSFIYPKSPLYSNNIPFIEYNPQKAIQILNDLGWQKNKYGYLCKDGQEFHIRIATNAENSLRKKVQSLIVQYWSEIGIRTDIEIYSFEKFSELMQHGQKGAFDTILFSWDCNPQFEKGELYSAQTFSGSNIPTKNNNFTGLNISGWDNQDYTNLFFKGLKEFNDTNRVNIFKEMQSIWFNEQPSFPLFYLKKFYYTKRGLKNFSGDIKTRDVNNIYWGEF